jgi:hypothetical protein
MLVSNATVLHPGVGAEGSTMVRASSLSAGHVLHERARADLDVEHKRARALGDLLAHDRARDERDGLDGAGDVTQRVELLVGGRQARAGGADDRTDLLELAQHLLVAHRRLPTRDRLQLVEGAAGVPEPASRTTAARPPHMLRRAEPAAG